MSELIYPRLKEVFLGGDEPVVTVDLISHPFMEGVEIMYLLDAGATYEYLSSERLNALSVSESTVFDLSIRNLERLLMGRGEVTRYSNGLGMATQLDGFESSLLLLPKKLEELGIERSTSCFAVPHRDVLVFCPARDAAARAELERVTKKVFAEGPPSHRVSGRLLVPSEDHESGYAWLDGRSGTSDEPPGGRTKFH